jgi:hypothetical protein
MADRGRGRGRGQQGYRGRGRGRGGASTLANDASNPRVCYEFKNTGSCKRGNCGFSHGLVNGGAAKSRIMPTREPDIPEQREARQAYSAWRRFLGSEPNESNTYRLWAGALKILEEGDRDRKQQLVQDLDTDDKNHKGRRHIEALMSSRVHNGATTQFIENSRRFLLTVTHPSLLDSLAVDTYVGSIYNFISGANGTRAVLFLQHLGEALVTAWTETHLSISAEVFDSTLVAMSIALRELLKRESRARFNDNLPALVDAMGIVANMGAAAKPSVSSTIVLNHARCIRDMVARANGLLLTHPGDDNDSTQPASSYPRDLVIPSDRHDNDKLDMTQIVIFPTRDEIMSNAREFLPFTDPDQPHFLEDPAQRHIDTYFRLLRHDIFGEHKATLASLMQAISHDKNVVNSANLPLSDVRAYHYNGTCIDRVAFGRALELHMRFLPPVSIRNKTVSAQKKWWEESRRLGNGSLLSFIWIQSEVVQHVFLTLARKSAKDRDDGILVSDRGLVEITAQPMTQDKPTLEMLMQAAASGSQGILLEFPHVMPATFVPILESLQDMQRLGGMPFHQWIVPNSHNEPSDVKVYHDIPPPLYARRAGFTFPLRAITNGADDSLSVDATSPGDNKELLDKIEANTTLDRGQCQALLAALTREFAFIQGPPGTGKSYLGVHLMRVLLGVKKKAKLGPVLVVCYTNHALDQFLEHLIEVGITKIIRVGGQSKSKLLANHNLQHLRQSETNTKAEKGMAWQSYQDMDGHKYNATELLDEIRHIHEQADWKSLKAHINDEHNNIYCQFKDTDDEGFQMVGRHPFDLWRVTDTRAFDAPTAYTQQPLTNIANIVRKANANVFSLRYSERQMLVDHWIQEIHEAKVAELFEVVDGAASTQTKLENVHAESSRRILQEADVIGLTTSGLAGRISLLKRLPCKVLICEEAGEILEPHMISALLPTIEHCIQIGDHEQLRPSVSNFDELSLESERGKLHQLDKSQFERLSVGEARRPSVPIAQLNVQRRMRPEISTLIRETLYRKLLDHPSTVELPDVVGLRQNVFWLDHTHLEDAMQMDFQHSKSKSNAWEVEMVHALVRHVVRQGTYKSSDIAVLTPYTGQLQKLRAAMRNDFEIVLSERDEEALEKDGFKLDDARPTDERIAAAMEHGKKPLAKKQLSELLRIATVDNFQGEEAKVVIISLVRSNNKRNVGFLKTTNRINVLLSRAKHGMFLIGNTDTYSTVDMWQDVIGMLRANESVGSSLGLCCPRHPEKIMDVYEPDDFAKFSPEGGCSETCIDRLDCGHSCRAKCHSEAMHTAFQCEEACQRRHQPCDHPCQKETCGEPCGKCMIKVDNVKLPCGHIHNGVKCYLTLDLASIPCNVRVSKQVPGCLHNITIECSRDVAKPGFNCPTLCKSPLPCGHACPGTCGRCNKKDPGGKPVVKHFSCSEKCRRKMGTCNHTCDRLCHDGTDCGLCHKSCEVIARVLLWIFQDANDLQVRCKHSKCPHRCHEPCAPCSRDCEWFCEHQGQCTMPCSAPCNKLPCDERCAKTLPCGHQCPSICGEDCPIDCCQQCGMRHDENPDMIMFQAYSEINLDESPIIALGCGHFFTIETLDGHVSMKEVYEQDQATGRYTSLIENSHLAVEVPQCPNCRTPIRQYVTQRYNRLINKAVIDETTKRFIVSGQQELQNFEEQLRALDKDMEQSRQSMIPPITVPTGPPDARDRGIANVNYVLSELIKVRYNKARHLEQSIRSFQKRTDTQHQPANKLRQATLYAINKHRALDSVLADLSLDSSAATARYGGDQRIKHGGQLIYIKTQCLVLEDKFEVVDVVKAKFPIDVLPSNPLSSTLVAEAGKFLNDCLQVIDGCKREKLPRLAVESTLYYSRIARALGSSGLINDNDRKTMEEHREMAKQLLEKAAKLCEQPFQDSKALAEAVDHSLKLLGKEFYSEVTKEELESIKAAMVSGRGGIATHSGHWYKCRNGHPVSSVLLFIDMYTFSNIFKFAVGECGMPMEVARCPQCGEPVGGRNHEAVEGVTRAVEME